MATTYNGSGAALRPGYDVNFDDSRDAYFSLNPTYGCGPFGGATVAPLPFLPDRKVLIERLGLVVTTKSSVAADGTTNANLFVIIRGPGVLWATALTDAMENSTAGTHVNGWAASATYTGACLSQPFKAAATPDAAMTHSAELPSGGTATGTYTNIPLNTWYGASTAAATDTGVPVNNILAAGSQLGVLISSHASAGTTALVATLHVKYRTMRT